MINDNIHPLWKMRLARSGDARVFGEQSDVRRKMDDEGALRHFADVWQSKLEPEIRRAPVIPTTEAVELLEGKQREYAIDGYQYRQFSLDSVIFIARLNDGATENGNCDQLWPLGAHRDNTRLCMYFDTVDDRERFEEIARELGWDPKTLALSLATDFMIKFSGSAGGGARKGSKQ
jgi:hypothetical protein